MAPTAEEIRVIAGIRHDLHAHPELGYQERRTSGVVQRTLAEAGIEHKAGLARGTGVLGWLPATTDPDRARTVALRADMDALPILEATGKPYASTCPGVMHACGHDGHTSVLLGAARQLARTQERPHNVLFVFQPAEEGGAGGREMVRDGVLRGEVLGRPADVIYGLHCSPFDRVGTLATRVGPMMASTDEIHIQVHGRGGHAAMPNTGVDPIVVGAHLVTALQTVASRNVDPIESIVVTIAQFHGGTATNVIPHFVELAGTMRTLSPEVRELGRRRVREVAEGVAAAFGARAEVVIDEGYPVTINHPEAVARFQELAVGLIGAERVSECPPVMGGEDFSFYGYEIPACFYWLGIMPEGVEAYPPVHTPEFDFNDDALGLGIEMMTTLALRG